METTKLIADKVILIGIIWNITNTAKKDDPAEAIDYLNSNYKNISVSCDVLDSDGYDEVKSMAIELATKKINAQLKKDETYQSFKLKKSSKAIIEDCIDIQPLKCNVSEFGDSVIRRPSSGKKIVYSTVKESPKYDDR